MANDYLPKSLANLKTWLTNLKEFVITDGPGLDRTPTQILNDTALLDSMLNPTTDTLDKQAAALEAEGLARMAIKNGIEPLRKMINAYKSADGWNDGMGDAWQVNTSETHYDMSTHGPTISVMTEGGQTVIRGQKPGFTSVSIDMRLEGTAAWTTIGVKLSHFPFIDHTAPQVPGKPEKREYCARGYVGDDQAGQPSPIVTGVYNG